MAARRQKTNCSGIVVASSRLTIVEFNTHSLPQGCTSTLVHNHVSRDRLHQSSRSPLRWAGVSSGDHRCWLCLARALLVSKGLFSAGTWPTLNAFEHKKLHWHNTMYSFAVAYQEHGRWGRRKGKKEKMKNKKKGKKKRECRNDKNGPLQNVHFDPENTGKLPSNVRFSWEQSAFSGVSVHWGIGRAAF